MPKRFKRIYIEITDVCNLDCSFCPKTRRKPEFMDTSTFTEILEKVKGFTDHVYLHVKGEPLLHPELPKFLDICKMKDIKVNIVTNGILISKAGYLLDKPAVRQISFSLHAIDEKQADDILNFVHKANNIFISLRLWNQGSGIDNTDMIKKIKSSFNLEDIPEGDHIKLEKNIYLDQAEMFTWPGLDNELVGEKGFCLALRDQIAILVDGTVVPCCLDSEGIIRLGDLKESALQDILDGERARSIYDSFSNRQVKEPLCQHCSYRRRFG